MRYIYIIFRIILGILFIFSGYVKAIDPWGSAIKFEEYIEAMGLDIFSIFALYLSSILSIIELLTGYMLVFNIMTRKAGRAALVLIIFFIPLTLWLAITQKVTDCGCFGDAIKLTDWGTFWKNIILLLPAILVCIFWKKYPAKIHRVKQRVIFSIGLLFSIGIVIYSYNHLPLIDFRPYSIGSDIRKGMEIPEGADIDEFETTFKYEKSGVVKEFNQKNYPWQDTTWNYVSHEQKLIKKGYEPPIEDFFIEDENATDITNNILNAEVYLLIVSYKLEKTNFNFSYKNSYLPEVIHKAKSEDIPVALITSSTKIQIANCKAFLNTSMPVGRADEKLLKTIVRANPGVVLLNKGVVVGKWNIVDLPKNIEFNQLNKNTTEEIQQKYQRKKILLTLLIWGILTLITLIIIKLRKYEKKNCSRKLEDE